MGGPRLPVFTSLCVCGGGGGGGCDTLNIFVVLCPKVTKFEEINCSPLHPNV